MTKVFVCEWRFVSRVGGRFDWKDTIERTKNSIVREYVHCFASRSVLTSSTLEVDPHTLEHCYMQQSEVPFCQATVPIIHSIPIPHTIESKSKPAEEDPDKQTRNTDKRSKKKQWHPEIERSVRRRYWRKSLCVSEDLCRELEEDSIRRRQSREQRIRSWENTYPGSRSDLFWRHRL